ncbi:metal homeostatis protein bsd2 [Pholiota molesta]|nr:metal homeostatis protein bsd2 [Pholiota molesta]
MSARYAPLPNPRSAQDADREMEEAFDLEHDMEEDNDAHGAHESTPLTRPTPHSPKPAPPAAAADSSLQMETSAIPSGTYDFEREYDFPPPGSPPPPTSQALPNDYGNSNGFLPTAPVAIPKPRRSLFQRVAGAILPTHYQRLPTENHSTRPTGGGIENDGVFANVTAKPQPVRTVRAANGEVHIVPEDNQKESPPSYLEAQADAVPAYWETTIHAPAGLDGSQLIIDDLPTGSFLVFCLNIFVSFFFQFVGFLLTYLLHTSHAAKFGSRAGLGLTLIQYGFYSRAFASEEQGDDAAAVPTDAAWGKRTAGPSATIQTQMTPSSRDWLSFLFMTVGWFLLLSSVIGYWRVKRWESSIRAPAAPSTPTPQQLDRDVAVRRNLDHIFGYGYEEDHQEPEVQFQRTSTGELISADSPDARIASSLRAAGLI